MLLLLFDIVPQSEMKIDTSSTEVTEHDCVLIAKGGEVIDIFNGLNGRGFHNLLEAENEQSNSKEFYVQDMPKFVNHGHSSLKQQNSSKFLEDNIAEYMCPSEKVEVIDAVCQKLPFPFTSFWDVHHLSNKKPLPVSDTIPESDHDYNENKTCLSLPGKDIINSESTELKAELDPPSHSVKLFCLLSAICSDGTGETHAISPTQLPGISFSITRAQAIDSLEDYPIEEERNVQPSSINDDIVGEMEDILLNSRILNRHYVGPASGPSTASTSGTRETSLLIKPYEKIDDIEVIGIRKRKGGVSISERLVGVRECTFYVIRVWSGLDHWEVERRYNDFVTLYHKLRSLYSGQGWTLPSPWSSVERQHMALFRNTSDIRDRSVLIQECLRSIICSGPSSILYSAVHWFLGCEDVVPSSSPTESQTASSHIIDFSTKFSSAISLHVENWQCRSTTDLLKAQHHTCAGCNKQFSKDSSLLNNLAHVLGWGKPRVCEYTGQLFCSACHTNETAMLPARILHLWDFGQYPVSHLAIRYLHSIHEQPVLRVGSVNPLLMSKIPALQQVMNLRRRIGNMLSYVRCPFRRTIGQGLGGRKYLLEVNDFFSPKDLFDLSKGAFAALPVLLDTVSRKILEHITEQCLICCDVGMPCGARKACIDPSSLIFPFQEEDIEKCKSCGLAFHKSCLIEVKSCTCGISLPVKDSFSMQSRAFGSDMNIRLLNLFFSKARPEATKH